MMFIGAVGGATHGVCVLFMFIVFGTTIDEFALFAYCDGNPNPNIYNCSNRSTEREDLIDYINHPIIFYFCLIGVISFCAGWLQVSMFQMAAERQITKIRTLFFRSILKQEISWFDLNPTGEINSRLNE